MATHASTNAIDGQPQTVHDLDIKSNTRVSIEEASSPLPMAKQQGDEDIFIIPSTPLFAASPETLSAIAALDLNPRQPPSFTSLAFSPAASPWNVSPQVCVDEHNAAGDRPLVQSLAVGALVFDDDHRDNEDARRGPRVLLIQRAHHDTAPDRWETPAGKVDPALDATVLGAVARELWEETGLVAVRVRRAVPPGRDAGLPGPPDSVCGDRHGKKRWCFLAFEVELAAEPRRREVVLHPREHQAFTWAAEDEVRAERMEDGTPMPITNARMKQYILEGFRLRGMDHGSVEKVAGP